MFTILQSYVAVPLVVLVVFFLLVAIARPDRDEGGDGLYAVYLSVVGITALYLLLVFGVTCVEAVAERLIVDERHESSDGSFDSYDTPGFPAPILSSTTGDPDQATQVAVFAGLLALGAGVVFVFHNTRRRELTADADFEGSAAARVDRAYAAGVSFVAVTVGVIAFGIAGYGALRVSAPDVTGSLDSLEEQQGLAQLLAYSALLVATIILFRMHFWAVRDRDPEPDLVDE